jgi:antitoxin ParD1/3/4
MRDWPSMRADVRALDREDAAPAEWLRLKVDEAFADPRLPSPARDVFKRLRAHHARRVKAARNGKV